MTDPAPGTSAAEAVEEVARTAYGRLVAYLASSTGDIAAAEDALSEAFVAALRTWPVRGVPGRPDSWLLTAARRTLIDAGRRRSTATRALPQLARLVEQDPSSEGPSEVPDVRLQLVFACAHPAVAEAARAPLVLQTVLGLDAARIAAVFLIPPATMSQRLVRAKTKIRAAGIPFRVPPAGLLPDRLPVVLDAVYAAYTAGWDDAAGGQAGAGDLTEEALRLARLVVLVLPEEPEARGLLSLLLASSARRAARRTGDGRFVPLEEQDVGLWSPTLVAEAEEQLQTASRAGRLGPYQLMAAIQSVHNRRALSGRTDRRAVADLHAGLARLTPTVGVLVAHAAAVLAADGPGPALRLLDALPSDRVAGYQPYWVVRARALAPDDPQAAGVARRRAVALTVDPAVRAHLERDGR